MFFYVFINMLTFVLLLVMKIHNICVWGGPEFEPRKKIHPNFLGELRGFICMPLELAYFSIL